MKQLCFVLMAGILVGLSGLAINISAADPVSDMTNLIAQADTSH